MNYLPVNGLRIFAVETSLLVITFLVVWLVMRLSHLHATAPAWVQWILARNWRGVAFVILAALFARGLLIPVVGIPAPRINDEYSYLLMADTFAHHRLSNPTPAGWQHFETFHVNMQPSYHSKYPVAHGLFLAFGQVVFHEPWAGVYLSTALLCGAICWALQAFVPPGWALLGGLLAVVRIALWSFWANSYFGPQVAALGGALALGAVVRIFEPGQSRRSRVLASISFAAGLLILATSRPYEGLAFSLPLLAYFSYRLLKEAVGKSGSARALKERSFSDAASPVLEGDGFSDTANSVLEGHGFSRAGSPSLFSPLRGLQSARHIYLDALLPLVLIGVMGIIGIGYYDHATTGDARLQPYPLNYQTYWPLPLFFGQTEVRQLKPADPVFTEYFKTIKQEYEFDKANTAAGIFSLEIRRFWEDWFFYVGPALTLPVLIGLVSCVVRPQLRIVALSFLATIIALALYIYSMSHYAAVLTVAVFVFTVEGLRYLWDTHQRGERAFAIAVIVTVIVASIARQAAISTMNTGYRFPDQRRIITEQLHIWPGKHLVLVTYDLERHYPGNELVHNGADFDSEKILWARSKGFASDLDLCRAYPDRSFWGVTTDDMHFSLGPINLCRDGSEH